MDVPPLGAPDGHTQGVVDTAPVRLWVAHEQREDRQAGRVRGGPAFGTQSVAAQVEHGSRSRLPAVAVAARVIELIQLATALLEHEDVLVSFFAGPLDRRVRRDRIGTRGRFFGGFGELDRNLSL